MVLPFTPKWTYPSVNAEPYTLRLPTPMPAEHVCGACCASPPDVGATERIRIDGHWQPTSLGAAPSPRYRRPDRPPRVEGSGVRQRRGAGGTGGDIVQQAESSRGPSARPPTTPAGRGCRQNRWQSRSEMESALMTSRPGSGRPTLSPTEVRDILKGVRPGPPARHPVHRPAGPRRARAPGRTFGIVAAGLRQRDDGGHHQRAGRLTGDRRPPSAHERAGETAWFSCAGPSPIRQAMASAACALSCPKAASLHRARQ